VTGHGQNNLGWKTEGVRGIIEEMNDERNYHNRFPPMERTNAQGLLNRVMRQIFGKKGGLTKEGWGVLLNDDL